MANVVIDDREIEYGPYSKQCTFCRNLHENNDNLIPSCSAYPDQIPLEIWQNKKSHLAPIDGDQGIQFEIDENVNEENFDRSKIGID